MPARQPFTALCRAAARPPSSGRADLHVHTTCSDGLYTPAQIVELARRSGLAAVAITDHDTLDGIPPAQAAAVGSGVEVVAGVEITAEFRDRELHLLGYFVRLDDTDLGSALERLRQHRVGRFWDMVERLNACGVSLDKRELCARAQTGVLGRRHLAALLVQAKKAGSMREAFARYLHDRGRAAVPKLRLPVAEAIARVRGAGGVAAWAHPSYDCTRESLAQLRDLGLQALEVEYPGYRPGQVRELRARAAEFGLLTTGGSDCHGPEPPGRTVGACGVSGKELEALRLRATADEE
jgi:predicted metal-dependent phosphoesterase TrpH